MASSGQLRGTRGLAVSRSRCEPAVRSMSAAAETDGSADC